MQSFNPTCYHLLFFSTIIMHSRYTVSGYVTSLGHFTSANALFNTTLKFFTVNHKDVSLFCGDWIGSTLNINIRLDNEAILFGITKKSWSALNLILPLCRFNIYKMKMSENRPFLALLKLDLKRYYTLDKYISITNDSTGNFIKKMGLFQTIGSRLTSYFVYFFAVNVTYFQRICNIRSGLKCE